MITPSENTPQPRTTTATEVPAAPSNAHELEEVPPGQKVSVASFNNKKFFIGVQIAALLKRETFNLYRSMKIKHVSISRATHDQVLFLVKAGAVRSGTHSVTLLDYDACLTYLREEVSKKRRSEPDITSPSKMDFDRQPLKQRRASSVATLGGMQEMTLTPNLPAEFHATNMQGSIRAPAMRHLAGQTWEPETPMVFVRDRERDMHPLQTLPQTDGNRWYFRPPPPASSPMYWMPVAPGNHTMPSTSHPSAEPAAASQWSSSAAPTAPADQAPDRRLLERVDALVQGEVESLQDLASEL